MDYPSAEDAAVAIDEAAYGCSASSSSSSVYRHPFSSFKFSSADTGTGTGTEASPSPSPSPEAGTTKDTLSERLASINLKRHSGSDFLHTTSSSIPPSPSPSYAGSQHSMDEYEMDSPSSLSSWNSFMSGHRGDLADVEDLELGEPELATVSEMDEDGGGASASAGQSFSTTAAGASAAAAARNAIVAESEDDEHHPQIGHGLGFGDRLSRRRGGGGGGGGGGPHHVVGGPTYHHHHHGHTGLSHFSPRTGGHGLSHHSRWSSRTPASLAARRRKGRIAELAEEGDVGGAAIKTTQMPSRGGGGSNEEAGGGGSDGSGIAPTTHYHHYAQANNLPPAAASGGGRCGEQHIYPGTPPSTQWSEFAGPPPIPVRSVSPSETVPVVPSPLCECIAGDAAESAADVAGEANGGEDSLVTPTTSRIAGSRENAADGQDAAAGATGLTAPTPRRGVFESITSNALATEASSTHKAPVQVATPPVLATSPALTPPLDGASSSSSPPTSPVATRNVSPARIRRVSSGTLASSSSSPPSPTSSRRSHAPVPLRPCFSRRNSSQQSSSQPNSRDSPESRGRCHVRFSPAPPQTIRTHSPVDYDRSSCPINNRLSVRDVQEMQRMDMDMGLLSAKCSAIAAMTGGGAIGKDDADAIAEPDRDWLARPRRESTGALTRGAASATSSKASSSSSSSTPASRLSPAEHLRVQRERERERACRIAGIGTGLGGRNLGRGAGGQAVNPLIARFGLNTPPPPLPGSPLDRRISRTAPQTPGEGPSNQPPTVSSSSAARASSLQRTASEDRALRRSLVDSDADADGAVDESEADDYGGGIAADAAVRARAGGGGNTRERGRTTVVRGSTTAAATVPPPPPPTPLVPAVVRTAASPTPSRSTSPTHEPMATPVQSPRLATPTASPRTKAKSSYFDDASTAKQLDAARPSLAAVASKRPQTSYGFPSRASSGGGGGGATRRGGYDSPGSAYESGSEYDLIA